MALQRTTVAMEFPRVEISIEAWRFDLAERADGSDAGIAVVCAQARYFSVQWTGTPRPTRRHVTPREWRLIESEGYTISVGPVGADSAIASLITGERGKAVTVALWQRLDLRIPVHEMASVLDGYLERTPQRTRGGRVPTTYLK
jgi:hypothetical protein